MAEVDPGRSCLRHLVEQVIPEELQQVAVPGLRPRRVLLEPDARSTRSRSQDSKTLHPPSPVRTGRKSYLLWPLVDGAQFGQQAEEAAILDLLQTEIFFFRFRLQMCLKTMTS